MTITAHTQHISRTMIDTGLWAIQRYMMGKYGTATTEREISPLVWYIETGRATNDFIMAILTAKPFMVGRLLHRCSNMSVDDTIRELKTYASKVRGEAIA